MVDLSAAAYAVLSQNFGEHLPDILPAHPPAFDQANHHAHMRHHRRRPRLGWCGPCRQVWAGFRGRGLFLRSRRLRIGRPHRRPAFAVLDPLLALALLSPVVGDTALGGPLLAVGLFAAEGTAQVVATDIAWMGEEENAAMPAPGPAGSQVRLGSENRSQQQIILEHQSGDRACAIPVRPKLEMRLDRYCKKPKLSLRMPTLD